MGYGKIRMPGDGPSLSNTKTPLDAPPTTSQSPTLTLPVAPPVDRQWLQKLLYRYPTNTTEHTDPILDNKALVVAPMVDASDLPFRILCRRYGSNLCYTPMIHARMFLTNPHYRTQFWSNSGMPAEDRPLIAQMCGSDPSVLLECAKLIEGGVDGIDLNCGCPQGIAKRGNYGAFLLEQEELLVEIVRTLASNLSVPVSVKVRLLPDRGNDNTYDVVEDSIRLYTKLIDAGASLLTLHGRTRLQKGHETGYCDWDAIRRVVAALGHRVPILANGGIETMEDVVECLKVTGVDGIMSSEAILEYPPLFQQVGSSNDAPRVGRVRLAREYLELCGEYPPDEGGQGSGTKCIRSHLHRILHADLQNPTYGTTHRDAINVAQTLDDFSTIVDAIDAHHFAIQHNVSNETRSWYVRHRILDPETGDMVKNMHRFDKTKEVKSVELDEDTSACIMNMFGDEW
mmetsp:Transcript_44271/g.51898  ORF Transcript_44271/g.51898 Transcript_44271/m.51898 type:complete len:456 (-) Transcript_44271:115-1482(-)